MAGRFITIACLASAQPALTQIFKDAAKLHSNDCENCQEIEISLDLPVGLTKVLADALRNQPPNQLVNNIQFADANSGRPNANQKADMPWPVLAPMMNQQPQQVQIPNNMVAYAFSVPPSIPQFTPFGNQAPIVLSLPWNLPAPTAFGQQPMPNLFGLPSNMFGAQPINMFSAQMFPNPPSATTTVSMPSVRSPNSIVATGLPSVIKLDGVGQILNGTDQAKKIMDQLKALNIDSNQVDAILRNFASILMKGITAN